MNRTLCVDSMLCQDGTRQDNARTCQHRNRSARSSDRVRRVPQSHTSAEAAQVCGAHRRERKTFVCGSRAARWPFAC